MVDIQLILADQIDWPTAQNNGFDDGVDGPSAVIELQLGV
jgi:hypothetical protein